MFNIRWSKVISIKIGLGCMYHSLSTHVGAKNLAREGIKGIPFLRNRVSHTLEAQIIQCATYSNGLIG
jgi:hypothetical protein